jgi:hypothetical protein
LGGKENVNVRRNIREEFFDWQVQAGAEYLRKGRDLEKWLASKDFAPWARGEIEKLIRFDLAITESLRGVPLQSLLYHALVEAMNLMSERREYLQILDDELFCQKLGNGHGKPTQTRAA